MTAGLAAIGRASAPPRRRPRLALSIAACTIVGLTLLPLVYLVVRAGSGGNAWRILLRPSTGELLLKTGLLVVGVTLSSAIVGVSLAWLVTRTNLPGRRLIGVMAALPLVIPSYVAALALLGAFGPKGLLQQLALGPLGIERLPEIYGFPGAVVALTLSSYPYVYLLCTAALRTADPSLEEASRGLGRSSLATFARVTLPGLRPSLAAGSLLVALYTLSDFGAVSLMQYQALTRAIFLQYKALFDRTPAAILSLVLVAFTAVVLLLEERTRRGRRYHAGARGSSAPPRRVDLRAWRWPAVAYAWLVLGTFLLVPLAVLGYWLARAISRGEDLGGVWLPTLDSLWVSLAAAGLVTLAALPVAMLGRVGERRWTRAVRSAAYVPNALPGIVIALSLVFFAARYAEPVYQTIGLLLFAYLVRFLPQALAGSSSALAGVSPRLEEAAQGLGRRPLAAFVSVTLPLARAGILAGAALVFLSTMKELPATLLLRPIGFDTLATEVWKHTSTGSYSQAALPALLLVVVAAPFVYFLMARREPAPPG